MGRVQDKVALVTGAASGLGRAAAEALSREGARVVLTDVNVEGGERAAAAIPGARFARLDVTREGDWVEALAGVLAREGRLDVLVNNAGVGLARDIENTTLEQWRLVHAVNLDGVFLGCKHGIAAMRKGGALGPTQAGSIVNVSSVAGLVGVPQFPAYGSAKGAVRLLSKSVALHCARKGYPIRCNSLHPTFIETPMVEELMALGGDPARGRAYLEKQIPLGRLGKPEDVGAAVVYLASEESRMMTGAELVLDGGSSAQ
jgi:3(or 17)beta-hydroxysteroid dehydrogenase